jgi:hypothetical protein
VRLFVFGLFYGGCFAQAKSNFGSTATKFIELGSLGEAKALLCLSQPSATEKDLQNCRSFFYSFL